jgi:DNA-binding response OmpR family regulator
MNAMDDEATNYVFLVKINEGFAHQISMCLTENGYNPMVISDFQEAWQQYQKLTPVVVVIDYTLGQGEAMDFCRFLRQEGRKEVIIMLLDKDTVTERVLVLESGADDYLVKPYLTKLFMNLVDLYLQTETVVQDELTFADLFLNLSSRQVRRGDRLIDLTVKEFELLKYFMSHPEKVLTREDILAQVWGYDFRGESNVIEVYIRYLRLKICLKSERRLIHTVRKVGYVLRSE